MKEKEPVQDLTEKLAEAKDIIEDLMYQSAGRGSDSGGPYLSHDFLSAYEEAFDFLGWKDPHYVPELKCEWIDCNEHSTCGTRTPDGYKRLCSEHGRPFFK